MTLAEGTPVHYLTHIERLPIYNGTIDSGPFLRVDEPGEEPYEVYRVLPQGAGSTTIWSTESIGLGNVELSYWPMNGVPAS
jgi:hypothetical protein